MIYKLKCGIETQIDPADRGLLEKHIWAVSNGYVRRGWGESARLNRGKDGPK